MWDNFFSKTITPEGKNEDDFTDFWDPSSYNPLDSVEDLNSEQLKAWDFLQSRNDPKPTTQEYHEDPLEARMKAERAPNQTETTSKAPEQPQASSSASPTLS